MPGLLALFGEHIGSAMSDLADSIDPHSIGESRSSLIEQGLASVSWLPNDLLGSSRFFDDGSFLGCLAGDLVDYRRVPWNDIFDIVASGSFGRLSDLIGTYGILVLDKLRRIVFLISDRISMQPLYYMIRSDGFACSTSIATFCRLRDRPAFDVRWLYEFLYFNYAVNATTVLQHVSRLLPASVLSYDLAAKRAAVIHYARSFSKPSRMLEGREALEKAADVFSRRAPKYYAERVPCAASLTSGLDSRTVLAFAPEEARPRLSAYTYGVEGCSDLVTAPRIASRLGIDHRRIVFDDVFLRDLWRYIVETVHLSGGLERANRSTLAFVYRSLTDSARDFPVVLTGISGDHLFRDHIRGTGNVPSLISRDMMNTLQTGVMSMDGDRYRGAFGSDYERFQAHVKDAIGQLSERYGPLHTPASYVNFLIQEIAPKYFSGERSVASHFTILRSPFWDREIIELSFEIGLGTLGFSEMLPRKDRFRECLLQASLIQRASDGGTISLGGIPIQAYTLGNKTLFQLAKILFRGPVKFRAVFNRRAEVPIENWGQWFTSVIADDIGRLLSGEARISNYLSSDFVSKVRLGGDVIMLAKLLTAEIVLMLLENEWKPPDGSVPRKVFG